MLFKAIKYIVAGFVFGVILTKSEAVSWYRIFEMFRFESFHMFGIIAVAIATGLIGIQLIRKRNVRDIHGKPIEIADKEKGNARYWIGGLIFGLGWALAGACPGPIFILIGAGFWPMLLVLAGALIGTFMYGVVQRFLPH
ncbi:MAG: YeeE/YedE family protein [Chitinophagaceae bacterium]|nr:MAG: YeeE/YedE family protein [Chitinophagaceae bacterium]